MSKKAKVSKKHRAPAKSGPVWHQSAEEATLAAKPQYNGFACGYGAHGSTKYDRAKAKRAWKRATKQEGASHGPFALLIVRFAARGVVTNGGRCVAVLALCTLALVAACACATSAETNPSPSTSGPSATAAASTEQPSSTDETAATASQSGTPETPAATNKDSEPIVATPSTAGKLHVEGTSLVSENGKIVQLRGVSTHGLAWFPQYVNQTFFSELRNDWNANVVRLAMYTAEYGGYCTGGDQAQLLALVANGVEYAAQADMYAIVDWHILSDNNPLTHKDEAKTFFSATSAQFSQRNNVIYEICNEPNGGTSWEDVKRYAEEVIPVIRANDPDALIIVGTPTWSQDVDKAAQNPLAFDNIMYTMHFYAATHKQDLRNKLQTAVEGGLPVFVTEFGICDASGNGSIDYDSANAWISLMDSLNVSYVCWNLSNKDEASALFKSSCTKVSGFTDDDLSAEGLWLKGVLAQAH